MPFYCVEILLTSALLLHCVIHAAAKKKVPIKLDENDWCWMTQVSNDGLGHQLHDMLTLMALHGVPVDNTSGKRFGYDNWSVAVYCVQYLCDNMKWMFSHNRFFNLNVGSLFAIA